MRTTYLTIAAIVVTFSACSKTKPCADLAECERQAKVAAEGPGWPEVVPTNVKLPDTTPTPTALAGAIGGEKDCELVFAKDAWQAEKGSASAIIQAATPVPGRPWSGQCQAILLPGKVNRSNLTPLLPGPQPTAVTFNTVFGPDINNHKEDTIRMALGEQTSITVANMPPNGTHGIVDPGVVRVVLHDGKVQRILFVGVFKQDVVCPPAKGKDSANTACHTASPATPTKAEGQPPIVPAPAQAVETGPDGDNPSTSQQAEGTANSPQPQSPPFRDSAFGPKLTIDSKGRIAPIKRK